VRDWSRVDPETAHFLGSWNKTVSSFMIYPSTSKGRVCVVFVLPAGRERGIDRVKAVISVASINNGYLQMNTGDWDNSSFDSGGFLIRNGNYLGFASIRQGKPNIYPIAAFSDTLIPITSLSLANTVQNQRVIQKFSAAGCTDSLPSKNQAQVSTQRKRDDLDNTLTPQQRNLLDSAGIKIFVPAYIPSGFQVYDVKTYRGGIASGYSIIYRDNKRDMCFAIRATTGGIGGRIGGKYAYSYPISTRLFGNTSIVFTSDSFLDMSRRNLPSEAQKRTPQKYLGTEWARNTSVSTSFYGLIGADFVGQSYYGGRINQPAGICRNDITPLEAEKIIKSLKYIDDPISIKQPQISLPSVPPSSTPVKPTDTIAKYPSNNEFNAFDSKLRGNPESLVRLRGNQTEQRRKFQNEWKARNPNAAKFLGAWYTGDRYFYVFPSTVKGGTCVVTQDANGAMNMQVGTVLNRELRYGGDKGFFWRDRPNIIASRDSGSGRLYPIYATLRMPELSESMIGDMERQKCIVTLPS
jgi:hypothetical protein